MMKNDGLKYITADVNGLRRYGAFLFKKKKIKAEHRHP
jgi:hypothetical protein